MESIQRFAFFRIPLECSPLANTWASYLESTEGGKGGVVQGPPAYAAASSHMFANLIGIVGCWEGHRRVLRLTAGLGGSPSGAYTGAISLLACLVDWFD